MKRNNDKGCWNDEVKNIQIKREFYLGGNSTSDAAYFNQPVSSSSFENERKWSQLDQSYGFRKACWCNHENETFIQPNVSRSARPKRNDSSYTVHKPFRF